MISNRWPKPSKRLRRWTRWIDRALPSTGWFYPDEREAYQEEVTRARATAAHAYTATV